MGIAIKGMVWTTLDEKQLRVEDMETSHLINCIKLMERREQQGSPMWFYMKGIVLGRIQSKK